MSFKRFGYHFLRKAREIKAKIKKKRLTFLSSRERNGGQHGSYGLPKGEQKRLGKEM